MNNCLALLACNERNMKELRLDARQKNSQSVCKALEAGACARMQGSVFCDCPPTIRAYSLNVICIRSTLLW
jgi:hypothetical protein